MLLNQALIAVMIYSICADPPSLKQKNNDQEVTTAA